MPHLRGLAFDSAKGADLQHRVVAAVKGQGVPA